MWLMRTVSMSALILLITGCDEFDCQWRKSDADLIRSYQGRNLQTIYSAHLNFTSRCTPSRTTLAPLVARFGPRARSYGISHIESGNYRSLRAAVSVTAYVTAQSGSDCPAPERQKLLDAANNLRLPSKSQAILRASILRSCSAESAESPLNIKDYGG